MAALLELPEAAAGPAVRPLAALELLAPLDPPRSNVVAIGRNCGVGMWASADEHCQCGRPMPTLPGEDIDRAEVRLGKLSSAEWVRLVRGSRLVDHLQDMLKKHFDIASDELDDLSGTVTDIEEWLDQIARADPEAGVAGLDQSAARQIVAQLRRAVNDADAALARIGRRRRDEGPPPLSLPSARTRSLVFSSVPDRRRPHP